jgi:signal transduction histidine kinase
MSSSLRRNFPQKIAIITAATGAGFFLLGYVGILAWGGNGHTPTPIWPATAFGMCMVLRLGRNRLLDLAMLGAILVAGLLTNLLGGVTPDLSIGYSLINVLDVTAGVLTVRHLAQLRFAGMGAGLRLGLAAGIGASLFGAALAGLLTRSLGYANDWSSSIEWFFSNLLGVCIVFPLGMTVSFRQFAKLRLEHRFLEALGVFALLAATSVLAFRLSPYPLHFLVLCAAVLAAARFRLMGAGAALVVISAVALTSPGAFVANNPVARIEVMQLFLAVCSIICVRAAHVLNQRDLHAAILERRRRRAVRASRFKTQLLSHVSHEVRSPLSAIIGFSGMLESGTLAADRAQEFAQVIAHNGELLSRLHDDLLDLSRAEAGKLSIHPQRVGVADALKMCIDGIRLDATLGGKPLLLETPDAGLAVRADPVRLAQIINNLIANAYKYGDNHSPIRVRAQRLEDGFGRIEIANAGPGILARERKMVFQPFGRAEQIGRQVPGAGLGLSISKLLAEKQGGRIDFESIPGRQTRFWIDLPLAA